ncbi:hypothetical protein ATX32_11270 [Oenococcus oeni]|nr:hypothetical protein ATX32_11270 [Oenococcus oeni]
MALNNTELDEILAIHSKNVGVLDVKADMDVESRQDLGKAYTPGVAALSKIIEKNPGLKDKYTISGKLVAVVTDGSAVLGLGNIGTAAGSGRMVEKAAAKYSAQFVTIAGPLYIVNNQARELLKKEPSFNRAGNLIKKLDLIFCGIGTLSSIESIPAWNENKSIIFPGVNFKNVAGICLSA